MIVRALDLNHDFTFGKGANDYRADKNAVAQSIKTRLSSFIGDCFFNTGAGLDWFNLLGAKDKSALDLTIRSIILNTPNVTGIIEISSRVNEARGITIEYNVQTTFGILNNTFQLDIGV